MQPEYTPAFLERFWSKVDRNGPIPEYRPDLGPCWLWTASRSDKGYGWFSVVLNGRWANRKAHVVSWWIHRGEEVADGFNLDHLCRVRSCVRPTHLEAVDVATNVLRGTGVTALNAKKTHCVHGHSNWKPASNPRWRRCGSCRSQRKR